MGGCSSALQYEQEEHDMLLEAPPKKPDFSQVLSHPVVLAYFGKFLEQTFSYENLLFIRVMENFKMLEDPQELLEEAEQILVQFIMLSSPMELNLGYQLRMQTLEDVQKEPVPASFLPAEIEILKLLKHVSWPLFEKSALYQELSMRKELRMFGIALPEVAATEEELLEHLSPEVRAREISMSNARRDQLSPVMGPLSDPNDSQYSASTFSNGTSPNSSARYSQPRQRAKTQWDTTLPLPSLPKSSKLQDVDVAARMRAGSLPEDVLPTSDQATPLSPGSCVASDEVVRKYSDRMSLLQLRSVANQGSQPIGSIGLVDERTLSGLDADERMAIPPGSTRRRSSISSSHLVALGGHTRDKGSISLHGHLKAQMDTGENELLTQKERELSKIKADQQSLPSSPKSTLSSQQPISQTPSPRSRITRRPDIQQV